MKKITIISTIILFVATISTQAQESTSTTGGEASGSGGSASYTVGQVFYTTQTGTNGKSAVQGVQQPYEISTATGINETTIHLEMIVFPNPTTDYLTLKVEKPAGLSFQLFDLQGKVIENKKVTATTSSIKMKKLPKAVYFLKITKDNQVVKTFKIIKNQ